MKKLLFSLQGLLFVVFNFSLLVTLLQLSGHRNPLAKFNNGELNYNKHEDYDPSLGRLNTLSSLENYCDSLFTASTASTEKTEFQKTYTDIANAVIRKRFYHGYSFYGFSDNYFGLILSKATRAGLAAIVIPDDILKYPYGACSQQSIVMMELLKRKNILTRKITFKGDRYGHFSFEVFFKGSWHFYDPNMEPDMALLDSYQKPGIAFLAAHPAILTKLYKQHPKAMVLDIFQHYNYGSINEFPAPRALIFQRLTKIFSYTLWIFFLFAFIFVRRKYLRYSSKTYVRNSRIYFPQSTAGASSSYYPGITAPGA